MPSVLNGSRREEANSALALAGGVNLILSPEMTVALTKAYMMAPDGRCKTFDASANGYARGEGCGMVLLKRLSDAVADGDRILALVRGTAVNHDGRSNGLSAPNGPAQEAVIRAALADELRRLYQVAEGKIHIVPNGVAYHAFDGFINPAEVKARYGIAPMAPTIFCPGRMTLQKGMDMLVEAVPMTNVRVTHSDQVPAVVCARARRV